MLPYQVQDALKKLNQAGFQTYVVGGCVRDLLLEREPDDYDMTTSARPEQVMKIFAGHCIPTGLQHGTVTVREEGMSLEVTTFRSDGKYADHRHPVEVTFSDTLAEDLQRRDFTIGAMAMDAEGELVDLFGGQEDLRRGVIRCVGQAEERFNEDALRIMRGLRFAAVLGFSVEKETAEAMRRQAPLLRHIAVERLTVEMNKLLCGKNARQILLEFPDVIGTFIPEILPCVGFQQHNYHHIYDVWQHTACAVEHVPAQPTLRWAMLLHDIGKPHCFTTDEQGVGHFYGHGEISRQLSNDIMHRLKTDNATRQRVVTLVEWHDRDIPRTHKAMRRALHKLGEEALRQVIAVKRADNWAQAPEFRSRQADIDRAEAILEELLAQQSCVSLEQLQVNGRDMIALGLQGREIGAMLKALLEQVIDGTLPNDREILLQWVRKEI